MRFTRTAGACVAGLALAIVPLTAGSASAAGSPSLTKTDCVAGGGTYTFVKGVKTCTTTYPSEQVEDGTTVFAAWLDQPEGQYMATYTEIEFDWIKVTQTQKGKRPVMTSVTSTVVSRTVTPVGCTLNSTGTEEPQPLSVCEDLGLYPADI